MGRPQPTRSSERSLPQDQSHGGNKMSPHLHHRNHHPLQRNQQHQRRRTQVACARCRKRKIKCSGDPGDGTGCNNCKQSGIDVAHACFFNRVQSTEVSWFAAGQNASNSLPLYQDNLTSQAQFNHPSVYPYGSISNANVGSNFESYAQSPRPYPLAWRLPSSTSQPDSSIVQLGYPGSSEASNMTTTGNSLPPLVWHLHYGDPVRCFASHAHVNSSPSTRSLSTVDGGLPFSFGTQIPTAPNGSPLIDRQLPVPSGVRSTSEVSTQPPNYRAPLSWYSSGISQAIGRRFVPNVAECGESPDQSSTTLSSYNGHQQAFATQLPFSHDEQDSSSPSVSAPPHSSKYSLIGASPVYKDKTNSSDVTHVPASSYALPSLISPYPQFGDTSQADQHTNGYSFSVDPTRNSMNSTASVANYGTLINGQPYTPLDEGPLEQTSSSRELTHSRSHELVRRGSQAFRLPKRFNGQSNDRSAGASF